MFETILANEIRSRGESVRKAAREIGIAHTTLFRVLHGDKIDFDTLTKICNWIGISPANVLDAEYSSTDHLADKLRLFLDNNPVVAAALQEVIGKIENRELKPELMDDLLAYITFRISKSIREPIHL